MITIDDFAKVEIRVGKVVEATHPEISEKLIRLRVDFGPSTGSGQVSEIRTIFTGVRPFGYTFEDFLGKQFLFVTNLAPKRMPTFVETSAGKIGEESQGMILAVDPPPQSGVEASGEKPIFVTAEGMLIGSKVR